MQGLLIGQNTKETKLLDNEKNERLLETLTELQEESIEIARDNHQLLKAIDWKLWEIFKIVKSYADANNIEIKEPFAIDSQDD